MALYSFEGKYKKDLIQSLGKKPQRSKDAVVSAAQEQRQQREMLRMQTKGSVKIQACYRGYKTRNDIFAVERNCFKNTFQGLQSMPPSAQDIKKLIRSINFFFQSRVDEELMISFCGLLVRHQAIIKEVIFGYETLFQLKRFLTLLIQVIKNLATSGTNLSMGLRMLEVLLSEAELSKNGRNGAELLREIYLCIVNHGYFNMLRALCDQRIPVLSEVTIQPPTPLSSSLLEMIVKPLALPVRSPEYRISIVQRFCESFMATEYTNPVLSFILPSIRHSKIISGDEYITALHNQTDKPGIPHPLTLLHSFTTALQNLDTNPRPSIDRYLEILARLIPCLPCDVDSEESDLIFSPLNADLPSPTEMKAECLRILNSPHNVHVLVSHLSTSKSDDNVLSFCRISHILLSQLKEQFNSNCLLYTAALNSVFLRRLWHLCRSLSHVSSTGEKIPMLQKLNAGVYDLSELGVGGAAYSFTAILATFSTLYYHSCLTLHDKDFRTDVLGYHSSSNAFDNKELVKMVGLLRDACLGMIFLALPDEHPYAFQTPKSSRRNSEQYPKQRAEVIYLFNVTSNLIKHLYLRDVRVHFCPANHWLSNRIHIVADVLKVLYKNVDTFFDLQPLGGQDDEGENFVMMSVTDQRRLVVLTQLPFVISFEERVKIFHNLVRVDKALYQATDGISHRKTINLTCNRQRLYEDSYTKLSPESEPVLKYKMRVIMTNASGLEEAGIDGGGIFREYLSQLMVTAFDPIRGFFKYTDNKMLYPNPEASSVVDDVHKHFYFLGRLLGKALYENILVDIPFAEFFLSKVTNEENCDIHQLAELDALLYKNMMYVKSYEGDVSELGLDFTVTSEIFGVSSVVELKPNGKNIPVDNQNRVEYIYLLADYKLNKQIRAQCQAFTGGLASTIPLNWLRMFNHHELYVLIAGTDSVDTDDLFIHTQYTGGYSSDHPTIVMFWNVVREFSPALKSRLLKFVTSNSRAPLLGFKELSPPFTIQNSGVEVRLPSASTCVNLLKLPEFKDENTLREKLMYAINAEAGFELS